MIIMRGLPGSGKSTLAKELVGFSGVICSSDHYMIDKAGNYAFDPKRLAETHANCQNAAENACKHLISPVVIDNCNATSAHIEPYSRIADRYGYEIEYTYPETPWADDPQGCFEKCTHNVPLAAIERMAATFE